MFTAVDKIKLQGKKTSDKNVLQGLNKNKIIKKNMGLSIQLAEFILKEHIYQPLPKIVHTIGRPFLGFTESQMLELFKRNSFSPNLYQLENDNFTNEAKNLLKRTGQQSISDKTYFEALGATTSTIDISDYFRKSTDSDPK
ncbi:MAG: hypothetical protein EBU90_17430 [Proteobacteria bacterium]|nr:hypothetical protein [Pseudomonadota bacterium]NBP15296.1 hypothetical protein [bacterium]